MRLLPSKTKCCSPLSAALVLLTVERYPVDVSIRGIVSVTALSKENQCTMYLRIEKTIEKKNNNCKQIRIKTRREKVC